MLGWKIRVDTKSRLHRDERMNIHRKDITGESENGQTRSIESKKVRTNHAFLHYAELKLQ